MNPDTISDIEKIVEQLKGIETSILHLDGIDDFNRDDWYNHAGIMIYAMERYIKSHT